MNLHEFINLGKVPKITGDVNTIKVSHAVVCAKILLEFSNKVGLDISDIPEEESRRLFFISSLVEHNFHNYLQKERSYVSIDESMERFSTDRVVLPNLTEENPYLWVDTHELESDISGVLFMSNKAWKKELDWVRFHKTELELSFNGIIADQNHTERALGYVEDQVSILYFVEGEPTEYEGGLVFRSKIDITEGLSLEDFQTPDCDLYGTLSVVFDVFRRMRIGEFEEDISTYTSTAKKLQTEIVKKKQKKKKQTRTLTHTVRKLRHIIV